MLLFATAVIVVLVVSFMCSIFESVLLSLTRPQIEVLTRDGRAAGPLLARFKTDIDIPIAAILILNTAAHTIGASVAGASYSNVFDAGTLWIFSILFTIAVLLFTEIIPKTIGVTHALALAAPVAHGIRWLTVLLRPLVAASGYVSRLLRSDARIPVTSVDEIRLLASLGRSEGAVGPRTAGMIVGATQMRYLQAHDVMLPREGVSYLCSTMDRNSVVQYLHETGHSRYPLTTSDDLDDVTGVVFAKELLYWLLHNDAERIDWDALRHEVLVVPRSSPLPQLLRTYQDSHRHLAIVVDEYGSVEGIATLEDVLEEIVGDIRDESDEPVEEFTEQPDGVLVVAAAVDLRKLSSKLGIPWEPHIEASTIGGLVTEILERIPSVGDSIRWNGYRIEVLKADRHRVRLLSVRKDGV
jgi:CBS domain containing-hemolysin-like protein